MGSPTVALTTIESGCTKLFLVGSHTEKNQDSSSFSGLGYKVLAIDYRGFADSSHPPELSEASLLEDALTSVTWLRPRLGPGDRLVLWGHSLGAAVACR